MKKPMPWVKYNPISELFFFNVTPLVTRGYVRRLEMTDLYRDPDQKIDKVRLTLQVCYETAPRSHSYPYEMDVSYFDWH